MTAAQLDAVKTKIRLAFQGHVTAAGNITLAQRSGEGKLYELFMLSRIIQSMKRLEGLTFRLAGGNRLEFRSQGGPIDRNTSFIEVLRNQTVVGELMLDITFLTLGYSLRMQNGGFPQNVSYADYHELDIAMVRPGLQNGCMPPHDQIIMAAECKHTEMSKAFVRNMLGLRRELSFLQGGQMTNPVLSNWPRRFYSNRPSSALLLFCNDARVRNYRSISTIFDIDLRYKTM